MNSELLTIPDTASECQVSTRQIWKMMSNGLFGPEVIRLGRCVRVRASELRNWIDAGCPTETRGVKQH